MRFKPSLWLLVGSLFLSLFLACTENEPKSALDKLNAKQAELDAREMASFEADLARNPHDCPTLRARAKWYANHGNNSAYRNAIADITECLQFGPKDVREAAYFTRADLHSQLFRRTKDPAEKTACLADFDEAMKLNPRRSELYLSRARVLLDLFDEPFLAEEDVIHGSHLANYEEKTMDSEQIRFLLIAGVYKRLAEATKGTPASAEYKRTADNASKTWDMLYERERALNEALVRERNRQREAQNAAIRAEEARVASLDAERREKAEAELKEKQRKLWANRTRCPDCNGNGYIMRGASSEHHIDWVQTDAHHESMRVTHTETPSSRTTCTTCWGKGWLDDDDR